MNTLFVLLIITASLHLSSPAPPRRSDTLQPFELLMLDKLHQPWSKPDKKSEYPKKGEYLCKGGICKTKAEGCEDCQHPIPLNLGDWSES